MSKNELVEALKHMKVETGSLVCLGCGHENSCSAHGCAILRQAILLLEEPAHQWTIGGEDDDFDVKCPVCGWNDIFEACGIEIVKAIAEEMHYCQNCGGKMNGGADHDT